LCNVGDFNLSVSEFKEYEEAQLNIHNVYDNTINDLFPDFDYKQGVLVCIFFEGEESSKTR
jgi:hypothetical protein